MIPIALVIVLALGLLILGFLAPRFSRKPQGAVDHGLDKANANAKKAPEPLDKVMEPPTRAAHKVADAATETGRQARYKAE